MESVHWKGGSLSKLKKIKAPPPGLDAHQLEVYELGGSLSYHRFRNIDQDLRLYAPGCGAPTFVNGTNGGKMPCGGTLKQLDGTTGQYFCGACQRDLGLDQFSRPIVK
jgi:hypothetical protein